VFARALSFRRTHHVVALAYSSAALYAARIWWDRRLAGEEGLRTSLHKKLTGAVLLVMTLDSVGHLIAVRCARHATTSRSHGRPCSSASTLTLAAAVHRS
jgi:hypothetical protein